MFRKKKNLVIKDLPSYLQCCEDKEDYEESLEYLRSELYQKRSQLRSLRQKIYGLKPRIREHEKILNYFTRGIKAFEDNLEIKIGEDWENGRLGLRHKLINYYFEKVQKMYNENRHDPDFKQRHFALSEMKKCCDRVIQRITYLDYQFANPDERRNQQEREVLEQCRAIMDFINALEK